MMEELKQRILKEGRAKAEGGMGFLVEKGFAGGGQFLRDPNIPYHAPCHHHPHQRGQFHRTGLRVLFRFELPYGEGKVGVWEGLVFQRKVPPLGIERLEAMPHHCLTQYHTVLELLLGESPSPRSPRRGESR